MGLRGVRGAGIELRSKDSRGRLSPHWVVVASQRCRKVRVTCHYWYGLNGQTRVGVDLGYLRDVRDGW